MNSEDSFPEKLSDFLFYNRTIKKLKKKKESSRTSAEPTAEEGNTCLEKCRVAVCY